MVAEQRLRRQPDQSEQCKRPTGALLLFVFAFCLFGGWPNQSSALADTASTIPTAVTQYQATSTCATCHEKIVAQHNESMHAKSFSNPVFQAQYFKEIVPSLSGNETLATEAGKCIACHDPISFITNKGPIKSINQSNPELSGVICDLCHRITGFKGERPEGGNFISSPGQKKLGPFEHATNWHHVYHILQTKSQICAICHNDVNHNGLEIKSTYTEWKNSSYARRKIQCQDCHMNLKGSLTNGKPIFDSGKAATMSFAFQSGYERSTLYTHRFPGAHSRTQVKDAIEIKMNMGQESAAPGEEISIMLEVSNKKVGHSLPSGSADLRMLWLELSALINGEKVPIAASPTTPDSSFDVAGKNAFDQDILGKDIPDGSRLYRAIFVNGNDKQTLSSYNATKIIFDNRLQAEERRQERFTFKLPQELNGPVLLTAKINYLRYPSAFANSLQIEKAEPVTLTTVKKELPLK
jgi:hypothetical protein